MIGATSRFLVASNGNIGIGTTTPGSSLEVSNGLSTNAFGSVLATTYAATSQGSGFFARKARGTLATPTAVQNGDTLGLFAAGGYGATHFGTLNAGGIGIRAAENWTDSAQGTSMNFSVTPTGSTTPLTALTMTPSGNVGMGTASPGGALEIVRQGSADILTTGFNGSTSSIVTRSARGLAATPSATLFGDLLGVFGGGGYDGTSFTFALAGMAPMAAEDWTSTAHGTALILGTTPVGTTQIQPRLGILDSGNVGIGTPLGAGGDPTATDRLQVFGDIRVGTNGTDGCVKNFGAGVIGGTCSSDRRFKKDITPFAPVLSRLTALQPVHYYWRAADFPERHFGNERTYGLVAQDVEPVLPELVVTGEDGYKAIDYSELPLLTIQAVKELKAENDALKQRVAELKSLEQRVAALEKLLQEKLTKSDRK
jgi:hypothetical protein